MKFGFDDYTHLDSAVHRWDPRLKLVGLLVLIFAFAFIRDPRTLLAMVIVTIVIYAISRLPISFLLNRLRYPSLFLLVVVILLPFLSGDTILASVGHIDIRQEGSQAALMVATRFISILTVGFVLFGTAPFITTMKAMRAIGTPALLTDMALLAFRYIYEIGDYLHRMRVSMKLRGFRDRRLGFQSLGVFAWLGGSILVRSYEHSDWVYKAMILRGYGQPTATTKCEFRARPADIIALGLTLAVAVGFIVSDVLI
jgi:cobalt/nickel transport system permease protein